MGEDKDMSQETHVVAQFLPTEDGEFNGNEQPEATELDDLAAARKWLSARWCVEHPNEGHVRQLAEYAASLRTATPRTRETVE